MNTSDSTRVLLHLHSKYKDNPVFFFRSADEYIPVHLSCESWQMLQLMFLRFIHRITSITTTVTGTMTRMYNLQSTAKVSHSKINIYRCTHYSEILRAILTAMYFFTLYKMGILVTGGLSVKSMPSR